MALPYTYHYTGKIENSLLQFMRIFTGFQVQYGVDRDDDDVNDFRKVTVHYGSPDRVVANVLTQNGTFTTTKLPIITGYMTSLDLNPEARKARKHEENVKWYDEATQTNKAVSKLMATPYIANVDLSIWASNQQQMFQIMEQILLIFNPRLSIQTTEDIHDWSYLTNVELIGIANEENFPPGPEDQYVIQTLNFQFEFWLNFPKIERGNVIEEITANMNDNTNEIVFMEDITIDENTPS